MPLGAQSGRLHRCIEPQGASLVCAGERLSPTPLQKRQNIAENLLYLPYQSLHTLKSAIFYRLTQKIQLFIRYTNKSAVFHRFV
jgi:hypothetical protein